MVMAGSGLSRDWPSSGQKRGHRPGNLSSGDPQHPPRDPSVPGFCSSFLTRKLIPEKSRVWNPEKPKLSGRRGFSPQQSRDSELEASAPWPLHPAARPERPKLHSACQPAQDPGTPPSARLQTLQREAPRGLGSSPPLDTQSRAETPWPSPLVTAKEFFLSNNPVKAQLMPKMCPGAPPDGRWGRGGGVGDSSCYFRGDVEGRKAEGRSRPGL